MTKEESKVRPIESGVVACATHVTRPYLWLQLVSALTKFVTSNSTVAIYRVNWRQSNISVIWGVRPYLSAHVTTTR